jgi:multidrug efflux pump subunit AcrB
MNFVKFFVKNYQFTLTLFLALMVLGINSLLNIPRSEDPPFGAPMFTVVAIYPGTNPTDMEQLVADPIEQELYKLNDIKKITTTIRDGLVILLVEFNFDVDVDGKNNDVIREINKIRNDLPSGIISLDIKRAASSDVAILQTALVSETAPFSQLKSLSEELENEIERIKDIKWVEIQGIPENNIRIDLDLEKLASYKIGLNQVLGLLQANNINIPGGDIDLGKRTYNIKTLSEFTDLDDIGNTIVKTSAEGNTTKLKEIASIYRSDKETNHITKLNGERAIWVLTAMKDKKHIIKTRAEIQKILDVFEKKLPSNIKMVQAFDQEKGVKHRLSGLGRDFVIAIFLVLLTLLPLGTRASFIVMISIPLSLSIGLFLLDMLGYTLNQLSIVGMVIALGLLVDDSIVVVENIERYMRTGISAREASITATNHILVAIFGCTATLILAFIPLANLPEGSGDFIRSMPMAVMLTVLASLFVSITIVPFLCSILLKAHEKDSHDNGNIFFRSFKKYINTPYQELLKWCMIHPWKMFGVAALLFGGSLMLIPSIGFSLFPTSEKPIVLVEIQTEPSSNIEHTYRIAKRIEDFIRAKKEVVQVATNVGKGNPRIYYNEFQTQNSGNIAELAVFLDAQATVPDIEKFTNQLSEELSNYAGAEIVVKRYQQGPPVSAPIEMRIHGQNLDTLNNISKKIESLIEKTPGTKYISNELKYEKADINIEIDKQKAGLYGLTSSEIAKTVRLAIAGIDIGELHNGDGDENKISVSIKQNIANPIDNFNRINITSFSGALVPLKNVASISFKPSASVIRHFNKERYALVNSFIQPGFNTENLTDEILEKINKEVKLPEGYRVIAAGERASREESFEGLGTIIILTVFGLLSILILEFKTFKSTFIVLSVLPMGIIGAILALYFADETMSFVATIGIIALAGIEIKNSILMVDYTNGLRAQGVGLYEAVMDGAETRFLPILLTSLTAIGGLIPIALESSPLTSPLALVLIGGLISSTLLSRLVTPVLYYLIPPKI